MTFCKHAAALGLTWIKEPGTFFNMNTVPELLSQKSTEELQELILQMIREIQKTLTGFETLSGLG